MSQVWQPLTAGMCRKASDFIKQEYNSVEERKAHDQKIVGSVLGRIGREISSPELTFCTESWFGIRITPELPQ